MQHAGNNKTPFGARITGVAALAVLLLTTTQASAVQAGSAGSAASGASQASEAPKRAEMPPILPTPPLPQNASAPARALPAMPVPIAPQAASAASQASEASAASAASAAEAASAASAASEAAVPEVPLPPEPDVPNVAQRTGLAPKGAYAMRQTFAKEVNRRLDVPAADQQAYGRALQHALDAHGQGDLANEFVVLVDRAENAQALFVYFRAKPGEAWSMIGASPVSTGRPGTYDHFLTPLGVFQHMPGNMDFRAEGTLNEFGIRGYGARDMRIYDFGWADGERGWGKGGVSPMRFQMHATDPEKLESVLGMRHSKGCVRIPATLNTFFDHHGIIDAQYEARASEGQSMWVLKSNRQTTPWAGRYLVVIDTAKKARPAWSPRPGKAARQQVPAAANNVD
ncbi:L,D-transpeptidase [Caballeronia sp. ATUFL_M2_KS44]|uniref:L,D-transpeptidase n=1 Tax=Caballeronia sp. ATUFL_M2_KS44 TaxID=2921767 RepID=UPI002028A8A0|nr:L,D-transpeptidase [Caballeronia sp. ATUFL_M2_KS44]